MVLMYLTSSVRQNTNFRSTGVYAVHVDSTGKSRVFTNHRLYFSCSSSLFQHIEVQQRTLKIVNRIGKKTKNARSVMAQLSFFLFVPVSFLIFILRRMPVYSTRAANTKTMQAMSQASMAVRPSAYNQDMGKKSKWINQIELWHIDFDFIYQIDLIKIQGDCCQ